LDLKYIPLVERRRSTRCFTKLAQYKTQRAKPRQCGRIFICWLGRGCLLNAGAKSDFDIVVNILYAEVYVAINVVGFFYCAVTVGAVT
jgi:hypothetical protein